MIDFNLHINAVKHFEDIAKEIEAAYPKYEGKDKSLKSMQGHLVRYWERAKLIIKKHISFEKPREINAYLTELATGEKGCPLLYIDDKDGKPCLALMKIVSVENNDVPAIVSRTGKMVQPYKLDLSGKIVKTLEPKQIKAWSISAMISVILQTEYFNNLLLGEEGFDIDKELTVIRTNMQLAEKRKALGITAKKQTRPYMRIVSVPMGGMNKRR